METPKNILSKNIFQEGKIAHGTAFIGRQDLLKSLINLWNESDGNSSRSIVGLNRMGKSSLVCRFCEMVKEQNPDAFCINLTLNQNTWPALIQLIMRTILEDAMDEMRKLDPLIEEICTKTCELVLNPSLPTHESIETKIMMNYKRLLQRMEKKKQKYLLIIDEFDSAKFCWKDHGRYFEDLRDSAHKYVGFNLIVSRRPLEVIEMDSYGNSCFHNVFPEMHVCAFDPVLDMPEYYASLENHYAVTLDDAEREKVEAYTGFCPTFLAGLGNKLASAAIQQNPIPTVDAVFSDSHFQTNYQKHYKEFLERMQDDGLWNPLVCFLMDIFAVQIDDGSPFQEAQINTLCCKGYLRKKQNGEYVVFSDDFAAWAKHRLFRSEIDTIYDRIIAAEVSIREMLKRKMPQIWSVRYPGHDWESDFLNNVNVPKDARYFTNKQLKGYLDSAKRYDTNAGVADAMTIRVKLILVKEFWSDGIDQCFDAQPYDAWKECFKVIEDIRNPLFHAQISSASSSSQHYYLLKEANDNANRIIKQLSANR